MKDKTSTTNLFGKGIILALRNIWRNKFLSLATIFVMGIIIFIFNIILAVNFIANDSIRALSEKIDITVYLQESTTPEEANKIADDISNLEGVIDVLYISKEEALNQLSLTHPDISNAFEKYGLGNPLPASLSIKTKHPKYHQQIADFLNRDKYLAKLSNVVTAESSNGTNAIITSVSKNLNNVANFAQQIIFWLIVTFLVGGVLIILNALQITIFSRKKEIEVMKLVGAPRWFIRLPFMTESAIYGLLAIIISFIMFFTISKNIQISEIDRFYNIFIIELVATITLSVISSMIAVHEYMGKTLLED